MGLGRAEIIFCAGIERRADGSIHAVAPHTHDIEFPAPGAGELFALARGHFPQSGSFKYLTFQLLDGSAVVDEITYFGAALAPEAGRHVDHVFEVAPYLLVRERRLTVRTKTDRGALPCSAIAISFEPPF